MAQKVKLLRGSKLLMCATNCANGRNTLRQLRVIAQVSRSVTKGLRYGSVNSYEEDEREH